MSGTPAQWLASNGEGMLSRVCGDAEFRTPTLVDTLLASGHPAQGISGFDKPLVALVSTPGQDQALIVDMLLAHGAQWSDACGDDGMPAGQWLLRMGVDVHHLARWVAPCTPTERNAAWGSATRILSLLSLSVHGSDNHRRALWQVFWNAGLVDASNVGPDSSPMAWCQAWWRSHELTQLSQAMPLSPPPDSRRPARL